jgi:hypothetical protein
VNLKNWSERLIWATILISVVRYAAAFAASDVGEITGIWSNILTFLLSITGVGMGFLDTAGGGLLFNGWSRVFPKHGQRWSVRFVVLTACVFGLLASGLIILVPFSMSRLSHESVLTTLGGKNSIGAWVWAGMVNLIPYLLIAGVFVGNKMVVALEDEKVSESSAKDSSRPSETFGKFTKEMLSKDWRELRELLSYEQIVEMSRWNSQQISNMASATGKSVKTFENYRSAAKQKLENK